MEIQDVLVIILFVGVPLAQYLIRAMRQPERPPPAPQPQRPRQPPPLPNLPRPRPTALPQAKLPQATLPQPKLPQPVQQMKMPAGKPAVAAVPRAPAVTWKPAAAAGRYDVRTGPAVSARGLRNAAELRRAMVLMTILGPCRATEPYSGQ